MADYICKITPDLVNPNTSGSMDEHLVNGHSIQRTGYIEVENSGDRKIVVVNDGDEFNDTMQTLITAHDFIIAG